MIMPAIEVEHAYRACEEITHAEAANFYYGIRLLPRDKRQAMSAVYAFARRVDDIGDGHGEPSFKLAALQAKRESLAVVVSGSSGAASPADPITIALADAHRRFNLPLEALDLLIEGVELDVRDTRYETFDELVIYCRDVAGSIGRLCLAIFTDGEANGHASMADDLGVAMQLTNILRDVREDYENGRVYLPAEDLAKFDCDPATLGQPTPPPGFTRLVEFEAERARDWYATGWKLLGLLDRRSAACTGAMAGIYRHLLERISADPAAVLRGRVSLSGREKAIVAVKALAGMNGAGMNRAGMSRTRRRG